MPNLSGSFSGKANFQTIVTPEDVSNHELIVAEISGQQKSTDDNWNGGRIAYWGVTDLIAGSGTQRGYFVNEHADGGRDWGTFEGKVTASGAQPTLEGSWRFSGGTGKYSGLTGSGTYNGRMVSISEVEMKWEGAYELGSAKAHAG